jgi:hypothetical protein
MALWSGFLICLSFVAGAAAEALDPLSPETLARLTESEVSPTEVVLCYSSPEGAIPVPEPREQAVLRLTGMYYIALADGRENDAAALRQALDALGWPSPAVAGYPQERPKPAPIVQASPSLQEVLVRLRNQPGVRFQIPVTGSLEGTVWGTEVFTDDSSLAAAAVHAGLVEPGETRNTVVTMSGPQDSFQGSSSRGVSSYDYGAWSGSFELAPAEAFPDAPHLRIAPVSLFTGDYSAGVPVRLSEFVESELLTPETEIITWLTGHRGGSVWGSGQYTADSSLPAAAVHFGVLAEGESDFVKIVLLPGRESYKSATRNGVTTSSWESYSLSFRLERLSDKGPPRR